MRETATATGNMHKQLVKFGRVWTLRQIVSQTDRQTDILITILRTPPSEGRNNNNATKLSLGNDATKNTLQADATYTSL